MSNSNPPYLKLHVGEEPEAAIREPALSPAHQKLMQSFESMTGWTLRASPTNSAESNQSIGQELSDWQAGSARSTPFPLVAIDDMSEQLGPNQSAVSRVKCDELVSSINGIIGELIQTQTELKHREAELATAIPVITNRGDSEHLSFRLEQILLGAVKSVSGTSAALYLLDDGTSELKLRSSWGLPAKSFLDPARPLRGAIADLEALVGHAVVLEDTSLLPHWESPEDYPSAVCVPVSSTSTPLGTLWVFSNEKRDFSPRETEMLEIVAGRVAAELEREVIVAQNLETRDHDKQLALACHWQRDRLPTVPPMIEDLEVDGWTLQSNRIGGDFHDWSVLNDGRLALIVGDAQGAAIEAGLTAASVHAAVRAHAAHRPEPRHLLNHVNETMWSGALGDQFASLFFGLLNPETWEMTFSIAGSMSCFHVLESGVESFEEEFPMLGAEPDLNFRDVEIELAPGDTVVILSDGMKHALWKNGVSDEPDGLQNFLERHALAGCEGLLNLLSQIADRDQIDGVSFDRSVLVVERKPEKKRAKSKRRNPSNRRT